MFKFKSSANLKWLIIGTLRPYLLANNKNNKKITITKITCLTLWKLLFTLRIIANIKIKNDIKNCWRVITPKIIVNAASVKLTKFNSPLIIFNDINKITLNNRLVKLSGKTPVDEKTIIGLKATSVGKVSDNNLSFSKTISPIL